MDRDLNEMKGLWSLEVSEESVSYTYVEIKCLISVTDETLQQSDSSDAIRKALVGTEVDYTLW